MSYASAYQVNFNDLRQMESEFVLPGYNYPGSRVDYDYDEDELPIAAGDLTINRNANDGRVSGTSLGTITDTFGYSNYGETSSYNAVYGTTALYSYSLTRDSLGRVATATETFPSGTTAMRTLTTAPVG